MKRQVCASFVSCEEVKSKRSLERHDIGKNAVAKTCHWKDFLFERNAVGKRDYCVCPEKE